jgi:transcription elongation factor Elf1
MTIQTDLSFMHDISHRLARFTKKKDNLYNFRCPYCGDSKKSKIKARGFIYRKKNNLYFVCHNCGQSTTFGNFLKFIDPEIHQRYVLEKYKDGQSQNPSAKITSAPKDIPYQKVTMPTKDELHNLKRVSDLPETHPIYRYCENRLIPRDYYKDLRIVSKFYKFLESIDQLTFPYNPENDHPRLIIPFRDANGTLLGFQGRAFGEEKPKYLTTMLKQAPKIFGFDRLDFKQTVYILEGPIDSMFVPNSLAMAGADTDLTGEQFVFVYDNEPRSPEIVNRMEKRIEMGDKVVIWDDTIQQKDINDMRLAGMFETPEEIKKIIDNSTYQGLSAKVKIAEWKKCV